MFIGDLLDYEATQKRIRDGLVSRQAHPDFPDRLFILNYTHKAQFEQAWDEITTVTRGVIYDAASGDVLARPFAKFFNYGDPKAGEFGPDTPILGAWDKLDGSLGIGYNRPDGMPAIATRGSFASEQALHATERYTAHLDQSNKAILRFPAQTTFLYEIVYPGNRIVVDYGDTDALFFLGTVDIPTGDYHPPVGMADKRATSPLQQGGTLRDALALPNRENAEGVVVWFDGKRAMKIKQEDYLALHKIVTGLNRKEVWRQLVSGDFDTWAAKLPDEFYDWATKVQLELVTEAETIVWEAQGDFETITDSLETTTHPPQESREYRKLFAGEAVKLPTKQYLFALLDGEPIYPLALKAVEPKGE